MSSRLLIAPLALGLLAGCNTVDPVSGYVDPGFGEAVKYNAAVQIIDPAPVYTELDAQPGDMGAKGSEAVKRYRTDAVKEVEQIETTTGGAGGPQ
jgi:predicted small secreted protein